jgi:hypothetical protein
VRVAEPLVPANPDPAAKLALTPDVYVPALIPARLTLLRVAVPLPFVVAVPTFAPFNLKDTVWLPTGAPPAVTVKVAERLTVPPNVPLALLTVRVVGVGAATTSVPFFVAVSGV